METFTGGCWRPSGCDGNGRGGRTPVCVEAPGEEGRSLRGQAKKSEMGPQRKRPGSGRLTDT